MENIENLIFIPGWMDKAEFHGFRDGLEIWTENISSNRKIEAEYVCGFSLGAIFALLLWENNKNIKVILINPLFPKRKITHWFFCWLKFIFSEGTRMPLKRILVLFHIISGIKKGLDLLKVDAERIIGEIPKNNLVIIRGKKDKFFCDDESIDYFKKKSIKFSEVENIGHNWSNNFKEEIIKLIKFNL